MPTNVGDTVRLYRRRKRNWGTGVIGLQGRYPSRCCYRLKERTAAVFCQELSTFQSGPAWYLVGRIHNKADLAAELTLITWEVGNDDQEVVAAARVYVRFLTR